VRHPYLRDVLWSDVSKYQTWVDDTYPYDVLAIRSNDGTYRDEKFPANLAWSKRALAAGKLRALIDYLVYRPNWQQTLDTIKAMVGTPHPRMAVMVDVESWSGQIKGDQSLGINNLVNGLAAWLGDNRKVIGYGNTGDLNSLWPHKPDGMRLIIAAYGSNPDYPGKLGHQFTDGATKDHLLVPPFGYADVNSADGYDIDSFCAALGIGGPPATLLGEDMPANEWKTSTSPELHVVCFPVGAKVSSLVTQGWIGIFPAEDATVSVEMFGGGHSLAKFDEVAPRRDRWWKELPDGTEGVEVTISTKTPSVAGWCLELKSKA
jgi:hypothetical protein